ncbi:E3 ubiquitin-protein ligase CIP8 [Brassica rapa]|uniref:RING-type E3 ubiquitin transferase n=1 Tax=Brassica campestris TaxID=3711 RepID=A0A3P6D0K6_BRACM|nr:E3 ubiquitin-protein ligase CIP8 [Brassica rapa]CAG7911717.1 unnamed protein product [Brassica rapa]VDD20470.1 unnamed protein product [Brassica rapa]
MDPSHQRVEQSQVTLPRDDDNDGTVSRDVIVGNCDVVVELGLGSGTVFIENIDSDVVDVNNLNGFDEPDDDDLELRGIASMGSQIRLITIESGSDDDDDHHENEREVWGIDLNDDDDVYDDEDDDDDVNVTIPLCWDSLQVEDRGVAAEEFDWEEVDGGGGLVDEREILTGFAEIDDGDGDGLEDEREIEILTGFAEADIDEDTSVSISISPMISSEGLDTGERTEGAANLEWEVLLNSHTLEINFDVGNREIFLTGDNEVNINAPEYDMLFEQFSQAGLANLRRFPPASRSFIKDLPMVQLDVEKDEGAVCAVCKDEMDVGTEAVGLPCDHKYHTECIVPWLKTRNTCPVCRYELPTDSTDYERRKSQRTTTSSNNIW